MPEHQKPEIGLNGINQALLRAVPVDALRILDIECGEGELGIALKRLVSHRRVFGTECRTSMATRAAGEGKLDQVFAIDIAVEDPPLERGSLDCILLSDVLLHLRSPEMVLRRLRRFLAPGGSVLCRIPNLQHHSVFAALLTGDFQHTASGMLDAMHPRFLTASTIPKLFLDAGYAPRIVETVRVPCPPALLAAARPLFDHCGLHQGRMANYLSVHQYVVQGLPLEESDETAGDFSSGQEPLRKDIPLSIVACVSDESILQSNLLASPCLRGDSPHQVILLRGCSSAAEGLNSGIEQARYPLVVLTHQDVYLPHGWPGRLVRAYRQAEQRFGPLGVAGVYGVASAGATSCRVGHVVDRDILRVEQTPLPAAVVTLDELLMVVPRDTPLRVDPSLGFHFYGADLCLAAHERGLAAVALDALCFHNSRTIDVPAAFLTSANRFAAKWAAQLPIATPCVLIDRQGEIQRF